MLASEIPVAMRLKLSNGGVVALFRAVITESTPVRQVFKPL